MCGNTYVQSSQWKSKVFLDPVFFFFFWPGHRTCEILVLQPGTEARPMAVKALSPYHWTPREFPL